MDTLDGRIALVTGASRGIGAAIARTLHQAGVRLGLASRSGDDLGLPDVVAQPADVRDPAALKAIADATAEHFGGIDILVVNAGVGAYGPFLELPQEQADEMIDVNVKGAIYAVRAGLPHLLRSRACRPGDHRQRGGRRTAQRGGLLRVQVRAGRPPPPPSTTSREQGVRCTNICPGGVATDFAMGRGRTPDMPHVGMMKPQDVADAVLFVVSRPRTHRILEVASGPSPRPPGAERMDDAALGDPVDGRHRPQEGRTRHAQGAALRDRRHRRERPVARRPSPPSWDPRAHPRTRRCWPTRRSTRSTSRCRTTCTPSGRSPPPGRQARPAESRWPSIPTTPSA